MKDREEIQEKIEAEDFTVELFQGAEKHCYTLLRQSIVPLWKASPSFKEAMKKLGIKDLNDLRATRLSQSKKKSRLTGDEHSVAMEDMIEIEKKF
jgi:hypothetical protein